MALYKAAPSEIPEGAVVLTEKEALKYNAELISNWKNSSDTFAVKHGSTILGAASLLSGIYLNSHFRSKLHLHNLGRMSTYLPVCILPGLFSFLFHSETVVSDLLLLKTKCPVCVEMRAAAIQSFFGFCYPMILSPLASLSIAHKYATYDVPYVTKKPVEVFKLLKKFTLPIKNVLFSIFLGQALLASVVTYFEAKAVFKVNTEMAALELLDLDEKEFD